MVVLARSCAELTVAQARFCAAMLESSSVTAAAATAGIKTRTAWHYMADERVKAELQRRQGALLAQVTAGLVADLDSARGVLRDIMQNVANGPAVRVAAARAILQYGAAFIEVYSLAERIETLERRAEGSKNGYR